MNVYTTNKIRNVVLLGHSSATNFWNSASFVKIASIVPSIRSRLSLKFWIADADISADIFRATENTTAAKMQNTSIIERNKEIPLSVPFLLF